MSTDASRPKKTPTGATVRSSPNRTKADARYLVIFRDGAMEEGLKELQNAAGIHRHCDRATLPCSGGHCYFVASNPSLGGARLR